MIHKLEDIKTTNNISYFNYKVKKINNHVHNNVVKIPKNHIEYEHIIKNNKGKTTNKYKMKYYEGQELIAKKHSILKNIDPSYELDDYNTVKSLKLFVRKFFCGSNQSFI